MTSYHPRYVMHGKEKILRVAIFSSPEAKTWYLSSGAMAMGDCVHGSWPLGRDSNLDHSMYLHVADRGGVWESINFAWCEGQLYRGNAQHLVMRRTTEMDRQLNTPEAVDRLGVFTNVISSINAIH